ncbi:Uu.00g030330.m01.CDS01 [Anthostomella pinea]|uniref:Uu.00g030330.m01.CDS01 n=1 Tax=Anthostomella pinea TaxID=933095 RepID=A0AAI8V8B0_9PEZI|nr:Uu.00g030330.m01.CDS01 [Anthostomella pinea]
MTEPATEQQPPVPAGDSLHHHAAGTGTTTAAAASQHQTPNPPPPPFAPIFALVNNTSTRTTHHPHVRYIFSDDDPDVLTQALAEHSDAHNIDASGSDPTNHAMILDLAPTNDAEGGNTKYSVAWSSSLSPSWAVLDTQLSQISPPSSDGENSSNNGGGGDGDDGDGSNNRNINNSRPDRLMLRIEGVESGALGSSSTLTELRVSSEANTNTSASGSGSRSGQRDRADSEDYSGIVGEFERRMATLRKVVNASEDRRRMIRSTHPDEEQPEPTAVQVQEPASEEKAAAAE